MGKELHEFPLLWPLSWEHRPGGGCTTSIMTVLMVPAGSLTPRRGEGNCGPGGGILGCFRDSLGLLMGKAEGAVKSL